MNENIKELGTKVKDFFGKMDKKVRNLLTFGLAAIVILAVVIALFLNTRPYAVLFTGLSTEEITSIVAYLDENAVTNYRIEGDQILVPSSQEPQLKAALLLQGYPKSGFGYETYQSFVGTLSSSEDRKIAYLYDLQDRIAATIRCFEGVSDAVVNITQGEDRRYVLDNDNYADASAAVTLTLRGTQKLSQQTASAIRLLVTHAVSGLEIGNVHISDNLGNSYDAAEGIGELSDASALKLQLEEQVNNNVRTEIMSALIPFYGEENIRVGVNSTVDVSRSVSESVTYTEPAWGADGSTGGRGIIGSHVYDWEVITDEEGTVGGVVGTETNSDISTYPEYGAAVDGDEYYVRSGGTLNYNVDTTKEQKERPSAIITDIMVSVSINSATAGNINTQTLLDHVARASGIQAELQADKISILVAPFYTPPTTDGAVDGEAGNTLPAWIVYAAIGGVVLLLVLLIIISIIRRRSRKKKAKALGSLIDQEFMTIQAPVQGADIMQVQTEKSMELRQEIRQFADQNPEIAAQMLKSWMRGGEEDG